MSRQHPYQALIDAIQTIEDFVINAEIGEQLIFTICNDTDETNNLPVVDFSLQRRDTTEILGDLNFDSFEGAIVALAKELTGSQVQR